MCLGVEERAAEQGLLPINLDWAAQFGEQVAAHGKDLWYYYTPFLLGLERSGDRRVFVGQMCGSSIVLVHRTVRRRMTCNLVFPPLPLSKMALEAAVNAATALAPGGEHRVMWCDDTDAALIRMWGVGKKDPQPPDLLYDPDRVAALSGGAFRDLRKLVHRVKRKLDINVRAALREDLDSCLDLLQAWFEARVGAIRPIGDMGYTRGALSLLGEVGPPVWDMAIYEIAGRPVAFAIGGEIRPGRICFFALKALPAIKGLSTYVRFDTLSRWRGRGLVNDGSALGRPGLEQHKRKFRPIAEISVWRVMLAA